MSERYNLIKEEYKCDYEHTKCNSAQNKKLSANEEDFC